MVNIFTSQKFETVPYYNSCISLEFIKNKHITNHGAVGVGLGTSLTPQTILTSQSFLQNNYKKRRRARGEGDQIWRQSHAGEFPLRREARGLRYRFPEKIDQAEDM